MDSSGSVHLNFSCSCKTCRSFYEGSASVLGPTPNCNSFPSLEKTFKCQSTKQNDLTGVELPKKKKKKHKKDKQTNKQHKFKVLSHGNTADRPASQKLAKTVTPASSSSSEFEHGKLFIRTFNRYQNRSRHSLANINFDSDTKVN